MQGHRDPCEPCFRRILNAISIHIMPDKVADRGSTTGRGGLCIGSCRIVFHVAGIVGCDTEEGIRMACFSRVSCVC